MCRYYPPVTYFISEMLCRFIKEYPLVSSPDQGRHVDFPNKLIVMSQVYCVGSVFASLLTYSYLTLPTAIRKLMPVHCVVFASLFSACSVSACWQCFSVAVAAAAAAAAGRLFRPVGLYRRHLRPVFAPAPGVCPRLPRPAAVAVSPVPVPLLQCPGEYSGARCFYTQHNLTFGHKFTQLVSRAPRDLSLVYTK